MSSIMLICAVLASLGAGVLAAHGICVALFAIFRTHARQVAAHKLPTPQAARLKVQQS